MTSKKTGYLLGAIAGAGVMAAAVAGAGLRMPEDTAEQTPISVIKAASTPIFAPPPGAPMSFADIFEQVSPAVVSINVTNRATARRGALPGFQGFPFNIIPRQPEGEDRDRQPRRRRRQSSGSGFFISENGFVVTNNHVIENAETIKVVLKDETELEATVVGRDEATDLAVLKVDGGRRPFPFVDFEDAATPRVGDWVITVGNPFGLGGTATAGIVSAYARELNETFLNYIQIDAAINRGNSGGPTFDVYGRVIGVNTSIYSPSGGSVGIGFAIPAKIAQSVTKQLMSGRSVERGFIGATIQNFTDNMADAVGLDGQRGAIVSNILPGGPSERAGLMVGDIILSVNGVDVKTSSELTRQVARASAGDTIKLGVVREGRRRMVEVRSGVRPSERELAANNNNEEGRSGPGGANPPSEARPPVLGMALGPIDEATRDRLNLGDVQGVLVEGIDQSSDAATKGLRPGDVITHANNRPVGKLADVEIAVEAVKQAGRSSVLVGRFRGGQTRFLALNITG